MSRKLKIASLLGCLVVVVFGAWLVFHYTSPNKTKLLSGDTYPLKVELITNKSDYKKSEYVTLSINITNVSDFLLEEDSSGCPAGTEVYMDRVIDITGRPKHSACVSSRTSMPIKPGQSVTTPLMQFNLGYVESGKHTLQAKIAYMDPYGRKYAESNEIKINLKPAKLVYDCNNYGDAVNTMCSQVMIRTSQDKNPKENNEICTKLRDNYLLKHHPNPLFIDSLSTASCNNGKPAVFVFNTGPTQTSSWEHVPRQVKTKYHICSATKYDINWLNHPTYGNKFC